MTTGVTIVSTSDMEWEKVLRGRVNTIRTKRLPLDCGIPGVVFEFAYVLVPDGYFTPRHRHNFDQIRYTLEGVQSTALGDLGPNECGYFPEGAYYGPQEQKGDCTALVLQFSGASGERMLSNEEMNATYQTLAAGGGRFENGVYKGTKPDGKPFNRDSYAAIWEHHEGRKLAFPKPRYRQPVMMMADRFGWVPDRRQAGVSSKHLGTFTEYRTAIGFLRLAAGTSLEAARQEDAEIRFVLQGSVQYGGREWPTGTYFYIAPGAMREALRSREGATFYTISLPMIADLVAERAREPAMAAA